MTACSIAQDILDCFQNDVFRKFANEATYAVTDENAVAEDNFVLFIIRYA